MLCTVYRSWTLAVSGEHRVTFKARLMCFVRVVVFSGIGVCVKLLAPQSSVVHRVAVSVSPRETNILIMLQSSACVV